MKIVKIDSGLGNQMFQYALYLKLRFIYGDMVKIDINSFNYNSFHNGYELDKVFNVSSPTSDLEESFRAGAKNSIYYSSNFLKKLHFKIALYKYCFCRTGFRNSITFFCDYSNPKSKFYVGGWQSEKYFKDISSVIRRTFKFPGLNKINSEIAYEISNSNSVSIHVRRGDYLNAENITFQNCCTPIYYKNAINRIKNEVVNPKFYVFSNDIAWCRENLGLEDARYIDWNKGKESYRDMQLMSLCKHNIIANSSFSWWGAWLNENTNKIVLAPSKWFDLPDCPMEDIYPNEWIKIPIV